MLTLFLLLLAGAFSLNVPSNLGCKPEEIAGPCLSDHTCPSSDWTCIGGDCCMESEIIQLKDDGGMSTWGTLKKLFHAE
ncbi:unnamed protein product [Cylicocyclus nassatus]|uniref:Uncharacterized protein n=1 Tax=Cylicocyclus nassatus TaxID=53992 RepID=A0AA36GJI9_CYLNA|nr:unnamed protein product [Cylicocyclus nassatus]